MTANDGPAWMQRAACVDHDAKIFFPENDGDAAAAASVCRVCPVRIDCLEYAFDNDERYGIWGGTTPLARERLRVAGEELGPCDDADSLNPRSDGA